MKRVNVLVSLVMAVCGVTLMASSCKKEKVDVLSNDLDAAEVNQPVPADDQLDVTYTGKACVFGASRTGFNASVVNRMKNAVTEPEADVKAFVFTSGYLMNLTEDQAEILVSAYLDNASFVLVNPSFPADGSLGESLDKAIGNLIRKGADVTGADELGELFTTAEQILDANSDPVEAVAFRGHSTYVVRDLEQMADESAETDGYEPTAYDYGKAADLLMKWIASGDDLLGSDAGETIEKYMTGYRSTVQRSVGPSRALGRTLPYELVYTVYSAYDFDKDVDYYFVSLKPNFHCDQLRCQSGDETWVRANKVVVFDNGLTSGDSGSWYEDLWYGPYMSKFDYTCKVSSEDGSTFYDVTLLDATPKTDVSGTVGYSTGIAWSLSGNLGFNMSGPMGGLAGGVSFSETHSHTENALRVYHKEENNVPNWRIEGIVPQYHTGWFHSYHDEVATFQKADWQTEFTWIFSIEHPQKDKPYYLYATDLTEISELNYNRYDLELRVHPTRTSIIKLEEPNRGVDTFIMSCSNGALQDEIARQFSQTWKNEFTYYAKDASSVDEGALEMFEKVKVAVNGYIPQLAAKGYSGTYTFYLNRSTGPALGNFTVTVEQ